MMGVANSPENATFTEQARRAQLLKAAIDTVNEVGFPQASLSAIARRAGVAKSAIAYYFSGKEALLLSVVSHVFGELDEQIEEAASQHSEPLARLRAYAEAYLHYVDTHRAEFAAGNEIIVSHRSPDGVPLYLTASDEDSALLRGILAEGMRQGVFRAMQPSNAVSIVEALLDVPAFQLQRDLEADLSGLNTAVLDSLMRVLEPR